MNFSVDTQFLTIRNWFSHALLKPIWFFVDTLLKIHYYTKGLNNYDYTLRSKSNEVKEKRIQV